MIANRGAAKRKQTPVSATPPGLSETKITYALAPRKTKKIKFGDVTVSAANLTDEQIEKNVALGQAALRRAASRIVRPGVSIRRRKGVPLFHIDADDPDIIIRTLDGVVERGFFADGEFKKNP